MVYLRSHLRRHYERAGLWDSWPCGLLGPSLAGKPLRNSGNWEMLWNHPDMGQGFENIYLSSPIPPWLVAALAVLSTFCPCLNWLRFSYGQQMPSDWEEVTGVYRVRLHTTSSVGQGEANGYRVYQRNTWRTQQKWSRSRSSDGSNFIRCANKIYVTKGTSFSHNLHVKIRI